MRDEIHQTFDPVQDRERYVSVERMRLAESVNLALIDSVPDKNMTCQPG